MRFKETDAKCSGHLLTVENDQGVRVGRAFLYVMYNALHERPFGFMEDVFIEEAYRGQSYGSELVKQLITRAKELGCYKLVATSRHARPRVHALYRELGFQEQGLEFRINF